MLHHALKDTAVHRLESTCSKIECMTGKHLYDVRRNTVGFFFVFIISIVGSLCNIILVDKFTSFINGNIAFNMSSGRILQIAGNLQAIYCLKANRCLPIASLLFLIGLTLTDILVEVDI